MNINIHIYETSKDSLFLRKMFKIALCKQNIKYMVDEDNIISFDSNKTFNPDALLNISQMYPNETIFVSHTDPDHFNSIITLVASGGKFIKKKETPIFPSGAMLV